VCAVQKYMNSLNFIFILKGINSVDVPLKIKYCSHIKFTE
jgi:hypothetical protein